MKYAIFYGCKIPYHLEHYGTSSRAVLRAFGIKTVELMFNCCGYPNRDISFESFILSSARNFALAEKKGLDIVTPCKCCFGSMKHAEHALKTNEILRDTINKMLSSEALHYSGKTRIKHILTVLCDDIGTDAIKRKVKKPQTGLTIAAHYGCHALRPSDITHFDDPFSPTIFEKLIEATGAKTVDWPRRLDCCGNPVLSRNRELSLALMNGKLADARESGADCVCTACTYCQMQFDMVQKNEYGKECGDALFPSILYTQLLGQSIGLPERDICIKKNARPLLP